MYGFNIEFFIIMLNFFKILWFDSSISKNSQHLCLRDTRQLVDANIDQDCEEIPNIVERHTMCKEGACLRVEKGRMAYR